MGVDGSEGAQRPLSVARLLCLSESHLPARLSLIFWRCAVRRMQTAAQSKPAFRLAFNQGS